MILSAQTIRKLCTEGDLANWYSGPLVHPFSERAVHRGATYGLGPAGYDIRIAEDIHLRRGEFKLASALEHLDMPNDVLAYVKDKSTYARRGLSLFNTVIEPGWRGFLTLELKNQGDNEFVIQRGSPIAQIVFHRLDGPTEQPYRGKYQDQEAGPQPARFER